MVGAVGCSQGLEDLQSLKLFVGWFLEEVDLGEPTVELPEKKKTQYVYGNSSRQKSMFNESACKYLLQHS